MEMYKPSLDWGNEIPHSLLWAAKAWLITAVVAVSCWSCWPATPPGAGSSGGSPAATSAGAAEPGVGLAGCAAVLDADHGAPQRAAQLLSNDLYSSLQVAFEGAGAGNEAVRDSGVHGFWTADHRLSR